MTTSNAGPTGDRANEARLQPTPCSEPPCDNGPGEPCDAHETEQAHTKGEHEHCGITCEAEFTSEKLRNFLLAKGYPGSAGMLDELPRRADAAGRGEAL